MGSTVEELVLAISDFDVCSVRLSAWCMINNARTVGSKSIHLSKHRIDRRVLLAVLKKACSLFGAVDLASSFA